MYPPFCQTSTSGWNPLLHTWTPTAVLLRTRPVA